MQIFLGLISSDQRLIDFFKKSQVGIIPSEARSMRRVQELNLSFQIGIFDPTTSLELMDKYLHRSTKTVDAAMLVVDKIHESIVTKLRVNDAYFVATVDATQSAHYKNVIKTALTRLLKNFTCLLSFMNEADKEQAIILPLRNFLAPELRELRALCATETLHNEFTRRLPSLVEALRDLRRPRRATSYKTQYFVDEDQKLFDYGKEIHAQLPTGEPHFTMCELTGTFRFGKRIPTNRHFNVTYEWGQETRIEGSFPNCHDDMVDVPQSTHINMFSNDCH
ncbi:hypothetical protein [Dyella choica]|uniref:Uncharacterized protein n=1 Tax=Dyella choica TaxID=1927959 RepID=A0A432MA85_9GAMM|nr:hypothetical protein [Dyella choica]RUL78255.1 hypothetical protein EKH80_05320 [Dyella choica]